MFLLNSSFSFDGLFGGILNSIFESVYSITPVWSLGIAIILFTIFIKLILLPLAIKQQVSIKATQKMQPELNALTAKYKNKKDKESQEKMAAELQEIYSRHKANPFLGCMLSFVQIPIIMILFNVLKKAHIYIDKLQVIYKGISSELMKVDNITTILENLNTAKKLPPVDFSNVLNVEGLLSNLTSADFTALLNDISGSINIDVVNNLIDQKENIELFMGVNLINQPTIFSISVIFPLITVLLTYLSINSATKEQRETADEKTASMLDSMKVMNKVMLVMIFMSSLSLPVGLSIYWSLNSILQVIQQKLIKKYIK